MRVDLHNHTYLCNHADGTMEEYVQTAIKNKIDIFGFSDHAPMLCDPKYRMGLEQMSFYENSILELKDKYKDDIKLLLAYEVDFLEGHILDDVINSKVDYLIGSVHFLHNKEDIWGFDNPEFIGVYKSKNIDSIWQEYFDAIEAMAKSNLFQIVGHLDLIKVFKYLPSKDIKLMAKNALKEIKKSNMAIELNPAGLRKPINEIYPSKELLEVAYELGVDITFCSDSHNVDNIGFGYKEATTLAKDVGYTNCVYFEEKEKINTIF